LTAWRGLKCTARISEGYVYIDEIMISMGGN